MKIKVCGMKNALNIQGVLELKPDMMGFIFYPFSLRNVDDSLAAEIKNYDWTETEKVGVFVESDISFVLEKVELFDLQWVQLHGLYEPEIIRELRKEIKIMRSIPVSSRYDVAAASIISDEVDLLLFDTKSELHGGSGKQFDWEILDVYSGDTPFLLSGGLNPDCVDSLHQFEHPSLAGIDLNSGFEFSPGLKNVDSLKNFIRKLKMEHHVSG